MHHNGNNRRRTARDPIAIMDALLHDVAVQAAEDHVSTDEDQRWAEDTVAKLHRQLAQLEPARGARPGAAPANRDVAIPDSIQHSIAKPCSSSWNSCDSAVRFAMHIST
ncbi:MAG TPA: hypothetical protein VFT22_05530 [Kofleriaceae bacterium]|nr:hypothetical protein [Kofleriaceae bacterium]